MVALHHYVLYIALLFVTTSYCVETYQSTQYLIIIHHGYHIDTTTTVFSYCLSGERHTIPDPYQLSIEYHVSPSDWMHLEDTRKYARDDVLDAIDFANQHIPEEKRATTMLLVLVEPDEDESVMEYLEKQYMPAVEEALREYQVWYPSFHHSLVSFTLETAFLFEAFYFQLLTCPESLQSSDQGLLFSDTPVDQQADAIEKAVPYVWDIVSFWPTVLPFFRGGTFFFCPEKRDQPTPIAISGSSSSVRVYSASGASSQTVYKGIGSDAVWASIASTLSDSTHPCIPYGIHYTDREGNTFLGSGNSEECLELIEQVLEKADLQPVEGLSDSGYVATGNFHSIRSTSLSSLCENYDIIEENWEREYGADWKTICFRAAHLRSILDAVSPSNSGTRQFPPVHWDGVAAGMALNYFSFLDGFLLTVPAIEDPYTGEVDNRFHFDFRNVIAEPFERVYI